MLVRIDLTPKALLPREDAESLIEYLLLSLKSNGQILKGYTITRTNYGTYSVYVTLPKEDSLDCAHDSEYVTRDRESISKYFDISVTHLGSRSEVDGYCTCETRSALEMQTYDTDIDSVFTCLDCGKPVALYELPLPFEGMDFTSVIHWQENYSAMHSLWINSDFDRYTVNQLEHYDSVLNKQGREIAKDIEDKSGCKVYYFIECYHGKKVNTAIVGREEIHVCPSCQKVMKRIKTTDSHVRDVCGICSLSFDAHPDQKGCHKILK